MFEVAYFIVMVTVALAVAVNLVTILASPDKEKRISTFIGMLLNALTLYVIYELGVRTSIIGGF